MDNQEISRLKARGKAELLAFVLFLTLLGGAAAEYRRETAPLATAAVVFERGKASRAAEPRNEIVQPAAAEAGKKAENSTAGATAGSMAAAETEATTIGAETSAMKATAPVSALSAPAVEEIAARVENGQNVSGGSQAAQGTEQAEISGEALTEFLDFMQETKEKVDAVSKPESALAKISQPETAAKPDTRSETVVFEEGKIEIYDSEKGVVAVEETAGENAAPANSEAKAVSNGEAASAAVSQSSAGAGEVAGAAETKGVNDVEKPVLLIPGQKDGESAKTTNNQTQPTVTAQENVSSETSVSAGGEAVDMMKDIAARQQAEDSAQK